MRTMALALALLGWGCGGPPDDTAPTPTGDGDADTDADADADTDTDADADTDTDADTGVAPHTGIPDDTVSHTGDPGRPTADTGPAPDQDGDGHDAVAAGGDDCDDLRSDVFPGAAEVCDGLDNDCDGLVDDDARDASTFHADADGDGHGDPAAPVEACAAPPGSVASDDDCDDGDSATFPGAPAVACDGADNDCDPATSEAGGVLLDGAPAATVADALASAGAGSLVELCEGRYLEPSLTIRAGITLRGLGGAGVTSLDAGGLSPVLRVDTPDPVVVEGLTLTGGLGLQAGNARQGGGLHVAPGGQVALRGSVLTGNVAGLGAGAWLGGGASLELADSAVTGNETDRTQAVVDFGGGIHAEDGVSLTLIRSTVERNVATACGGIRLGSDGRVVGDGLSTVRLNQERGLGGAGLCAGANVELEGLEVSYNSASNGGGGLRLEGGGRLTDLVVSTNVASLSGGGATLSGDYDLVRCSFLDNSGLDGGGVELVRGAAVVTDSTFTGNTTSFFAAYGGGVHLAPTGDARLTSVRTDWGPVGANRPVDVAVDAVLWDVTGVSDFTCDIATRRCQ